MLFSKHNLLTLIVIDNKLQSQKRTIPQNAANTAPLVSPELLALHSVGAAIRNNADYTGNEPVGILCTNCKVCRQTFNLADRCAIRNNKTAMASSSRPWSQKTTFSQRNIIFVPTPTWIPQASWRMQLQFWLLTPIPTISTSM